MRSRNGTFGSVSSVVLIATAVAGALAARRIARPAVVDAQASSLDISVNEATNFSVATSPDGRMLVADFQASLWTISAQGGPAKRITDPVLKATEPTFSPTGDEIVFQGYLDDGWDLWSVKPDGSNSRRLTWGPFDDTDPAVSHDGTRIAFTSERAGNLDIWVLDRRSGALSQVTKNAAADSLPVWSPDDREIAFVSQRTPTPGVWAVNVADGTERLVAEVRGRIGAPNWTPDGKQVIYAVVGGGAARLELAGKPVVSGEDVFPFRVNWVSGTDFIYSADGKIRKRTLGAAQAQDVPFTLTIPVARASGKLKRWDTDPMKPRKSLGIVHPAVSPDGTKVVFSALGDLWLMDVGGKPARLTTDKGALNADPAWSPDGTQLVYSSDRAGNGNLDLWLRDMKSGRERRLTDLPTADGQSAWSPDGKRIAFLTVLSHARGADLYIVDVEGGKAAKLQGFAGFSPSAPTWSPDGRTLLVAATFSYSRGRAAIYKMMAIPTDGGQGGFVELTPNSSLVLPVDEGPLWSPDGTRLAFVHQGLLNTVDVDRTGNPIGAIRQLSSELAHAPSWTGDSKRLLYLATDRLRMVTVEDGRVRDIPLDLQWRATVPQGRTVVHAGHVWNGRDKTLLTDRDIVIEGNRIRSIEPHKAALHTGRVIDAAARTVMPGLIDMHEHIYQQYGEALGRQLLAYGVTTIRDVGMEAYRSLEYKEMWESGDRIGPRAYLAGPAWDGSRTSYTEFYTIESGSRVDMELERHRRLGFEWFKLYARLPETLQRRIVEFAHESGMGVTSHEIYPVATWGVDGTEHLDENPFKASALGNMYADAMKLIAAGGMPICPTLNMNSYAVMAADDPALLTEDRIKQLVPDWALAGVRTRMDRLRESGPQAINDTVAQKGRQMLALMKQGVKIVAGTDAPNLPHGQALQVEIETYVRAGLTPFDALQTATINAAEALGAGADLGTIENGKIADLVIVDGDPLSDIKAARAVNTVIRNGRVYDMSALLTGPAAVRTNTTAAR